MIRFYRSLAAVTALALIVAAIALIVSAAAAGPTATTDVVPTDSTCQKVALSFAKDVQPLADYDNIIAKKYVVPGKPDASLYYMNPAGKAHHPGGNVWKEKSDMIKSWIACGAPK